MICDFKRIIEKHNMLSHGDRVVIGLSGGADSMTLLYLLNEIKDEYELDLVACHVNHCLRGEESDRDMIFVKEQCEKLNIKLETLVFDVSNEAKKTGESFEECGRRIRYDFFRQHCHEGKIATAHNLCDNEETVFLNLIRGTGISGLKGISRVRGNIIRPLLDFSRERIEEYCSLNDIPYVHDSTNDSVEYRRNFVRHNILTQVKSLEPSFDSSFQKFLSLIEQDIDYIEKQSDDLIESAKIDENLFDVSMFLNAHKAVCTRALSKIVYDYAKVQVEKKHIDILYDALSLKTKKVQITGGMFVNVKNDRFYFSKDITTVVPTVRIIVDKDRKYRFFDKDIFFSHLSQKVYNMFLFDYIDCDKIVGDLVLRNRLPGDRISLRKRNVTKSLKKLFCEDGIPEAERGKVAVLSDDLGVVWVEGYGCDNRCKVDENSSNILSVKCERQENENDE